MGGVGKAVGSVFSSMFGGGSGLELKQAESVEQMSSTPTEADDAVKNAAEDERRRRRAGSSTLLTGGQGAAGAASTAKKTLLG